MSGVTYRTNDSNAGAVPVDTRIAAARRNGEYHQSVTIFEDNLDAFSRLRTSNPTGLFDAQFTYDLQPLLFEAGISSSDAASVAHDSTNRAALMTLASSSTDYAFMQSYEHFRYQPGKSQEVFITFNMGGDDGNFVKYAGLTNFTNGYELQLVGNAPQFVIRTNTDNGTETAVQTDWNIDPLDGTGNSGITIDWTKEQILVIDFQALYVGRVRFGFDIGGAVIYAHQFTHANETEAPYIATANLPIRVGMYNTGTASTTMRFNCCSVISEGGQDDIAGYSFTCEGTATAGNNARAHVLSLRPNTTFNSITNRIKFVLDSVEIIVTGNAPVKWELVLGQAISGTITYTDVNATYSSFEYNTAGTIDGNPAIVIASGYVAATATSKTVTSAKFVNRYPMTLDAAGAVRALGTLSLLATGLGATSAMRGIFNWHEVR